MIENLIPAIYLNDSLIIKGVCTLSKCTFNENKHRFHDAIYFNKISDLVSDEEINLIIAASTPDVHYDTLNLCAKANKPLFIEKPSTTYFNKIDPHFFDSDYAKNKVFVGYNIAFSKIPELFISSINDSSIDPALIALRCFANKPHEIMWHLKSIFESFLYAVGIHAINFAIRLAGEMKINEITANATKCGKSGFNATAIIRYNSDRFINLLFSNIHPSFLWESDVQLMDGSFYRLKGSEKIYKTFSKKSKVETNHEETLSMLSNHTLSNGYNREIQSFLHTLENDTHCVNSLHHDQIVHDVIESIINGVNFYNEK